MFRRLAVLLAAAAIVLSGPVPVSAHDPSVVEAAGIVRVTSGAGWHVLSDTNHTPLNLAGVVCNTAGHLILDTPDVDQVVTFSITPDEAYAGRFHPGGSVGLTSTTVLIKDGAGAFVRCDSAALVIANSNFFVYFRGLVV